MSNIFGGNTGLTYEQVQQRQRVADQLRQANRNTPRNAGEGIHALARGLVARATDRQAKREEDRINAEWQEQVSGMGLDPQRAAIYSQLAHGQRAGAVLSHLDKQDAERRAAAARGAAASNRAAEEQRALEARMAIAQALQGRTVPNGQQMGPTVAAANAGAQSGADLAALQTKREAPTQQSVVQSLIGNPNVPLGMIDNAVGMLPQAPKPTSAMQEYNLAVQQGFDGSFTDYKTALASAGRNQTTVNNNMGGGVFDEAFAKGDAAALGAISESGMMAQRNMGRIDQLENLLANSPTGLAGAAKLAAGEFGINTDGLSEVQAAQALINSLVPEQRQPGSGPMSDADLALFKQSLPRIINQPDGNQTIINTMRAIAQYDAQGAAIVQSLRAGEIDRAQAFSALQSRQNPLAGFKPPVALPTDGTIPPAPDGLDDATWSRYYENMSPEERALFQ